MEYLEFFASDIYFHFLRGSFIASLPVPEYGSGRFSLQAWDFLAPDKHASGKMKKMNEILADSTLARSLG